MSKDHIGQCHFFTSTPTMLALLVLMHKKAKRPLSSLEVLAYVSTVAHRNGTLYTSYAQLGEKVGIDKANVGKAVKDLREMGFLEYIVRRDKTGSFFRLNPDWICTVRRSERVEAISLEKDTGEVVNTRKVAKVSNDLREIHKEYTGKPLLPEAHQLRLKWLSDVAPTSVIV